MARRSFKSILVHIVAPREERQLALERGAELARRTRARLILFQGVFHPYAMTPDYYRTTVDRGIERTLGLERAALERLAAPLRRRGLKVTVKIAWDDPPHEAVVREVLRSRPDLVVTESRRRGLGARVFLTNTDWQLIRLCPAPLLFVKNARPYGKARVLAAIDPLHAHARPARLDNRILEAARSLADACDGRLDVAHAWMPPSMLMAAGVAEPLLVPLDPEIDRMHERRVRQALARCVAPFKLPPRQLHLELGNPEGALPALARRLRADVLVMGAVSRRGLKRILIGNTAERTIDATNTDLLVVKPRGFRAPVPRKPAPVRWWIVPPI